MGTRCRALWQGYFTRKANRATGPVTPTNCGQATKPLHTGLVNSITRPAKAPEHHPGAPCGTEAEMWMVIDACPEAIGTGTVVALCAVHPRAVRVP
jgi:hypothetical protein